jgi:transcriptional regulator with XRE-family HTH domain
MKNKNWSALLTAEAELSLVETGRLLSEARQRRSLSIAELARRVGVDPRRISELEKGAPGVSLGIFMQVLSVLDLHKGFGELLRPENDVVTAGASLRKVRKNQKVHTPITDDESDF